MAREVKNVGASVRARLLNLAKAQGIDFQLLAIRYALERLLYRLSVSPRRAPRASPSAFNLSRQTGPHSRSMEPAGSAKPQDLGKRINENVDSRVKDRCPEGGRPVRGYRVADNPVRRGRSGKVAAIGLA